MAKDTYDSTDGSLVSVIMSVYKEPLDWVDMCIKSVLEQSYSNFEFIIVDDNPQDKDLDDFLNGYALRESRIRLVLNKENLGLTKSLNKACREMRGVFMARIDADDCWKDNKLQIQMDYMHMHPDVDVCGTWIELIDEQNQSCGRLIYPIRHIDIGKQMLFSNPIVHSSVLIRVSVLYNRLSNVYDETCKTSQDYALWTSLFDEGAIFANLSQYLVLYRCSLHQISKTKKDDQKNTTTKISENFTLSLFNKINLSNYQSINCMELSQKLKSSNIEKSLKPIYYHYLWINYSKLKRNKLIKLFYLLRTGDIVRFSIKDTAKLLIG
jgi:glycosyltransferase involved in cell wall biosynthesis